MIKKAFIIIIVSLLVLNLAVPAYCNTAIKKLGRGLSNIITSPFEVVLQMSRVNNTDGPMAGLTYGLLKGITMTGVRAVVGAYETLTFPIPFPGDYKPILTDPEFFYEEKEW